MSILIVDSGSTKTDWLFKHEGKAELFRTKGMNPFFWTRNMVIKEMEEEVILRTGRDIGAIYFYGAGVVDASHNIVKDSLSTVFPDTVSETHSDIIAACRALFGHNEGIACILGTGSNACLYDGEKITAQIPPLGFILGDECSGTDFGKRLIGDYFKKKIPKNLKSAFENEFSPQLADIITKTYKEDRPNMFLASFTPFISKNIGHPYCSDMVKECFRKFIERNVLPLPQCTNYPIGMIGSIAYHFQDILEMQLVRYDFDSPKILKDPIAGLEQFHQ